MSSLFSFLLLFFLCVLVSQASANSFWAAVCIARSKQCSPNAARLSRTCRPNKWAIGQWYGCRRDACKWCKPSWRRSKFPCNAVTIDRVCKNIKAPQPRQSPPKGPCSYRSSTSSIVIDLGFVPPQGGWTRISRSGYNGLVFRKDLSRGIARAGKQGVYCFNMIASQSGTYQLTAWSFTTDMTEHNDVWVRSSLGFSLWYDGRYWKNVGPSEWLKAYQNNAGYFADYLHTKDWDPHRFLIPNVVAGKRFNVCISGRSFRYEMYKLVVKKCQGQECRGYKIGTAIQNLPGSKCL